MKLVEWILAGCSRQPPKKVEQMPPHIAEQLGGGPFSPGLTKAMAEREAAITRQRVPGVYGPKLR